jgi:hypothetical protein
MQIRPVLGINRYRSCQLVLYVRLSVPIPRNRRGGCDRKGYFSTGLRAKDNEGHVRRSSFMVRKRLSKEQARNDNMSLNQLVLKSYHVFACVRHDRTSMALGPYPTPKTVNNHLKCLHISLPCQIEGAWMKWQAAW